MKSHKLNHKETSNRAELFMSIMAKYNCGKRINLISRGGFERRANLAALQYNSGHKWQISTWRKTFQSTAGVCLKKRMIRKDTINKARPILKKRKTTSIKKQINVEYGKHAQQVQLTEEEYNSEKNRIMQRLQVSLNPLQE